MSEADRSVFLSYCWDNLAEADQIDAFLTGRGVDVCRDRRVLRRGDNLKGFMQRIRCCEHCSMVISDQYLKSHNCMYEVAQAAKELDFSEKIRPLVLDNADVFSTGGRAGYLRYWEGQYEELARTIREFPNPETTQELCTDLGEIREIVNMIPKFLALLGGRYCARDIHTYLTALEEELPVGV